VGRRLRRKRVGLRSQNLLPLSLPALGAVVYAVVIHCIVLLLVVTWPFSVPPARYSAEYSSLATQLSLIHGGWLVLLLLNLVVIRTPKGARPHLHRSGDYGAIVLMSTLLAASLQMATAVPAPTDPPHEEGVFELRFDPAERAWVVETSEHH